MGLSQKENLKINVKNYIWSLNLKMKLWSLEVIFLYHIKFAFRTRIYMSNKI